MATRTPRKPSKFNSDPVESPFPFSPLQTSSPNQRISNNNDNHDFTSKQLREITTIFQLFDPTLSGFVDVSTFEVMMLSLGYRVTHHDILDMVQSILKEREQQEQEIIFDGSIDLSMAIEILYQKGYKKRNSDDEARIYFRLFDVNDKGYITIEDLKRVVQCEAVQLEQEMLSSSSSSSSNSSSGNVTDDFIQAILDKFDGKGDGTITFDEFRRIVQPILS